MSRTKSSNPKLFRKGKGNYRFRRFVNGTFEKNPGIHAW